MASGAEGAEAMVDGGLNNAEMGLLLIGGRVTAAAVLLITLASEERAFRLTPDASCEADNRICEEALDLSRGGACPVRADIACWF
jgi:hypothetical protein